MRDYLYGNVLSHVAGYLGKISEEELERFRPYGYRIKDLVGKDGIEKFYNDYLRGTNGGLQVEVDNKGRQLGLLAVKEPRAGKALYLSIDIGLQKFCDSVLADKKGAIIVMDPFTGEIFALVSHPSFDPNVFARPGNAKEVSALLNNSTDFPMLNRAISGTYAPGSVFKIVVAASALDTGKFSDKDTFSCKGVLTVGNRPFRCWRQKGHGTLTILGAMKYSCNVFFYQLGLLCGADTIARYAFKLGLGKPVGVDLPGEASGFVPTPSWKRKKLGAPWFKGETANYAIGQGYLLVTPIQIVRLVAAIANGGRLVRPFIVSRIEDVDLYHAESRDTGIKKDTLRILKECLRGVVNEPHGTGLYARSKNIVVAGKTGTAQNPKGISHAWFAGFAPFEDPKVCVVVFIEHGGKGGLDPARFAKQIIEEAQRLRLCE